VSLGSIGPGTNMMINVPVIFPDVVLQLSLHAKLRRFTHDASWKTVRQKAVFFLSV